MTDTNVYTGSDYSVSSALFTAAGEYRVHVRRIPTNEFWLPYLWTVIAPDGKEFRLYASTKGEAWEKAEQKVADDVSRLRPEMAHD